MLRTSLVASLLCLMPVQLLQAQSQPLPVKTVAFRSESVGRTMKFNLILPAKYEQSTERYPVLYLLHGLTSNYTAWARMKVPDYAAQYDMIVVMPDVGNSWYANWSKNEGGQRNNWEDGIIKDLIGYVDAHYRTVARREGRAINGLSMGGYGGLMLGLKHLDLFCSIGSHSGAVAFAKSMGERLREGRESAKSNRTPSEVPDKNIGIEGFSSQKERTPQGQLFATAEECDACDPFKLVMKLPKDKMPHIYFDCGTEDRLISSNLDFVKLLSDNKIPFSFSQSGGGHVPAYWSREVGNSMASQYAVMRRAMQAAARKNDQGAGK